MKTRKRTKRILILSIMLLLAFSTATVFAVWTTTLGPATNYNDATFNLGAGENILTTTLNVGDGTHAGNVLVPAGWETAGAVSSLAITFPVTWNATDGAAGTISDDSILITSTAGIVADNAFSAIATSGIGAIQHDTPVDVVVTVSINDQAAAYVHIAATLTLTLTLTVTPTP